MNTPAKRYQAIKLLSKQSYSVRQLCKVLEASQSGYYHSQSATPTPRLQRRKELTHHVKATFIKHKRRYGRIRIHRTLKAQGIEISEKMVGSIMKEQGLIARKKRPYRPQTTHRSTHAKYAPNLLENKASITKTNQCLVSDITYIPTKEGWLYLAGVMDLKSRVIKGYSIATTMPSSLVESALTKALTHYPKSRGAIVHSDRGSQYTSHQYRKIIAKYDLQLSMSDKGNCYDNAAMESFWSSLKTECLPESGVFESPQQAKASIYQYIESYYHTQRLHSSLGYMTPYQAEHQQKCTA